MFLILKWKILTQMRIKSYGLFAWVKMGNGLLKLNIQQLKMMSWILIIMGSWKDSLITSTVKNTNKKYLKINKTW